MTLLQWHLHCYCWFCYLNAVHWAVITVALRLYNCYYGTVNAMVCLCQCDRSLWHYYYITAYTYCSTVTMGIFLWHCNLGNFIMQLLLQRSYYATVTKALATGSITLLLWYCRNNTVTMALLLQQQPSRRINCKHNLVSSMNVNIYSTIN